MSQAIERSREEDDALSQAELEDLRHRGELSGQLQTLIRLVSVLILIGGLHLGWAVYRQQQIHSCVQAHKSYDETIGVGSSTYCLAN